MITSLQLNRQETIAKNTIAWFFQKPADFSFRAGQFVDLTLINPHEKDDFGSSRTLTIASSPHESELVFASRLSNSAFKKSFNQLIPGHLVKIDGPYGDFTLRPNHQGVVILIAGGIGVTPFRSIIKETVITNPSQRIVLIHLGKSIDDLPFYGELTKIEKTHLHIDYLPFAAPSKPIVWQNTKSYLISLQKDLLSASFYLAGSRNFIASAKNTLAELAIDDSTIKTDQFDGY